MFALGFRSYRALVPGSMACVTLVVLLVAAETGRAQAKKKPLPRWTVIKAEFMGADTIASPPAPGKKNSPPKPMRQFEFDEKGGRVVAPGMEKETPYVTISRAPDLEFQPDQYKLVDSLGQELAAPSTYVLGRNNQDTLVFKRASWEQFGELYLAGPGEQKVSLIKFVSVEKQAAWKLAAAKVLAEGDEAAKAKELCQQILKQYSRTKAAKDARKLLEGLKK